MQNMMMGADGNLYAVVAGEMACIQEATPAFMMEHHTFDGNPEEPDDEGGSVTFISLR